jgi:predicted nucleotidyltransferase
MVCGFRVALRREDTGVIKFTITGEELWTRMERAVEKVNERLRKTVKVLEDAKVPYAVIGGHAVRAWVAQVDEAALRTTQDVDILVRPGDLKALVEAMTAAGFYHRNTSGLDMFLEHPDASARDAVHVLLVGNIERGGEPNPDIEPAARANDFQTIGLETLVRMKLNAFRRKDQVHLLDMISLGMIDRSWPAKYPELLGRRLEELLNDPDG